MGDTTNNALGKRLRALRQAGQITLVELSKRSGVAAASLSRIETGKMTGTLKSHLAIAKALGVPLQDLYRDVAAEAPLVILRRRVDQGKDQFVAGKGVAFEMLTSKVLAKRMMPWLLTLAPGRATQGEESPPGVEQFLYVLTGTLEARVGTERYPLRPGDALYVSALLPREWRNTSRTVARCLCVTSPPTL